MQSGALLWSWLKNIGWTAMLAQAEVCTPGVADSMTKVSHVARTRYCHQVTAVVLRILQQEAYEQYGEECIDVGM